MLINRGLIIRDFLLSLFNEAIVEVRYEILYTKFAFDISTSRIHFFEGACIKRKKVPEAIYYNASEDYFFYACFAHTIQGKRKPALTFILDLEKENFSEFIKARMKNVSLIGKN